MGPLDLVQLTPLMDRTSGRPEIRIGVIDGPVALNQPDLAGASIHEVPGKLSGICNRADTVACSHGTFVAGILAARRGSVAPAICPGCTLLLRPIFAETANGNGVMPSATPEHLAEAIVDCVDAGARVLNMSAALTVPSSKGDRQLEDALDYAASRGAISVAAAGNQGTVGGSVITRHPAVIPVAACDLQGRPLNESNLGSSIGKRGLMAPGVGITSLGTSGKAQTLSGTSAAAPFVTGAIALLWSEFPAARVAEVKLAITRCHQQSRNTVVPPVLDAWGAYETASRGDSNVLLYRSAQCARATVCRWTGSER
jgi:subtilisin family serine protease